MKMFWNYMIEMVVTQHYECTKAIEFFALSQLILCFVDFTSIKKKQYP